MEEIEEIGTRNRKKITKVKNASLLKNILIPSMLMIYNTNIKKQYIL